jgi:hypothetical protein
LVTTVATGTRLFASTHTPELGLTTASEGLPVGPVGVAAFVSSSLLHPPAANASEIAAKSESSRERRCAREVIRRGARGEMASGMADF